MKGLSQYRDKIFIGLIYSKLIYFFSRLNVPLTDYKISPDIGIWQSFVSSARYGFEK